MSTLSELQPDGAAILIKAKKTYDAFLSEMRSKKVLDPGPAPDAQLRTIDGDKPPPQGGGSLRVEPKGDC